MFVETRLRELLASNEVDARVIAPVPWFPLRNPVFRSWSYFARTPEFEVRDGVEVWHPRYLLPPAVGMWVAPFMLALGARQRVASLLEAGFDFDFIDAHYYYPDGVAAAFLASWFRKPLFITARGTDLNVISKYVVPRWQIKWAAQRARASIAVSQSLADLLLRMNVPPGKVHTIRNGVDLARFRQGDKDECRRLLALRRDGAILLSVGNLVPLKGHVMMIDAIARIRASGNDATLVVVGIGPEMSRLKRRASTLGMDHAVRFVGHVDNEELWRWYSAADALILASSREGWPNVLLESMACGTPVVATKVGGVSEIVSDPVAGELVRTRDVESLVLALNRVLATRRDPTAVRGYAEKFGWRSTSRAQLDLFRSIRRDCCGPPQASPE